MTNAHIERTKRMIEVMQAYVDGECIEANGVALDSPSWDWSYSPYRITKTPDSINWDHVAPEFKWMARDESDVAYVYEDKPRICLDNWQSSGDVACVRHFSSYKRGTVDWEDSLVIRPGCE